MTKRLLRLPLSAAFLCLAFPFFANLASAASKDFREYYELDPIEVKGEEIPITIFARTEGDRRYATKFAHTVVEVVYQTIERSPGSGLVIMGRKDEPHPLSIFEKFMEAGKSDKVSPEFKKMASDLEAKLNEWRDRIHFDVDFEEDDGEADFPVDPNTIIQAFPIPLEGIAADLYLLAWSEDFSEERIDQRLATLTATDLQKPEFQGFNWIFYLPHKRAFDKALKEIIPAVLEAEKIGFFKRALIRGAVATFKPLIRDAIEGARRGILYWSVLESSKEFTEEDRKLLTEAYFESQMPKGRIIPGDKKDRALEAVRIQKLENEAYHQDPFVLPETMETFEAASYRKLFGEYGAEGHRLKRFFQQDGQLFWQEGDDEPVAYLPASNSLFVSTNQDITIEFFRDEFGSYNSVELRKGRQRWTFQRAPDVQIDTTP